jgi:hypothetical protein
MTKVTGKPGGPTFLRSLWDGQVPNDPPAVGISAEDWDLFCLHVRDGASYEACTVARGAYLSLEQVRYRVRRANEIALASCDKATRDVLWERVRRLNAAGVANRAQVRAAQARLGQDRFV